MTIKEYRETTPLKDQKAFAKKLQLWLRPYSQGVYTQIMKKMETIINNPFAMELINQLYEREIKEEAEEIQAIEYSLSSDDYLKYDLHCHPLTHSNSYRDVLYDMFIS